MDEAPWIISKIVEDLKNRADETGITKLNTPKATSLLESVGLLYYDEETKHRRPTRYGNLLGIYEEERVGLDGNSYIQVLYNNDAKCLVERVLRSVYGKAETTFHPATIAAVSASTSPKIYKEECTEKDATRTNYQRLLKHHSSEIIVFVYDDYCRTFDESAKQIGKLLGVDTYETAAGEIGIRFKQDMLAYIKSSIKYHKPPTKYIPSTIKEVPSTSRQLEKPDSKDTAQRTPTTAKKRVRTCTEPTIDIGSRFRLEGVAEEFLISTEIKAESIKRNDGSVEIVNVPVIASADDNVIVLTHESAFARKCIGKYLEDSIEFEGKIRKITSIQNP